MRKKSAVLVIRVIINSHSSERCLSLRSATKESAMAGKDKGGREAKKPKASAKNKKAATTIARPLTVEAKPKGNPTPK
jgi:hypothetical protein